MKNFLIITALTLPIGIFAQGPNTNNNPPAQVQTQNINFFLINNDDNINDNKAIQTNPGNFQQQVKIPAQGVPQSGWNPFGSVENNNDKPCNDCDEVKQAINASHASSGGSYNRKSFSMKKWSKTFSGKMKMKMKKTFAKKYKVKTTYSLCFNWH